MAKTFTNLTVANATAGNAILASDHAAAFTTLNSHTVPPSCQVRRTTNLTSYTTASSITWESVGWDTENTASPSDPMWSSGSATRVTIRTAGLYLVTFHGYITCTATMAIAYPAVLLNGNSCLDNYSPSNAGSAAMFNVSGVLDLSAADYLTFQVGAVGGSAHVIQGAATASNTQTRAEVTWIGRKA